MSHLLPNQVIQYVSGELPPGEQPAAQRHVGTCESCRYAVERQQALVALLRQALPDAASRDVTAQVLKRLDDRSEAAISRPRFGAPWRIAAAVLVGVGLGYVSGRLMLSDRPTQSASPSPAPDYQLFTMPDGVELWASFTDLETGQAEEES